MKLFSNIKKKSEDKATHRQKKDMEQRIVIISPRREVLAEITSQLLMHNFKNIIEHEIDFFTVEDDSITHNAVTVIVDIVNVNDVALISETATLLISATSRQIFIGNNDSIAFAQRLICSGLSYLHSGSQLVQLVDQIQNKNTEQSSRTSMNISILGCKGGVGTSMMAYQLFQATGSLSSLQMLLVQGASGSSDLDLLIGSPLPRDGSIFKLTANQAARIETKDNPWYYEDLHFNQYNLVFFDHGIYTQSQEHFEMVISHSHTIILVISRELTTLRVAKAIISEYNRIMLTRSSGNRRILVCLNENHPRCIDELGDEDIQEYLGCEISCINPYLTKGNKLNPDSPLYRFAAYLLGKSATKNSCKKKLTISSLLQRYLSSL